MNIFFLDSDPTKAAQYQCDKHVVKMILESAQLLCTTHRLKPLWDFPEKFYKATHKNHPCTIWARSHTSNYCWLTAHALALCEEYTFRYGRRHASQGIIEWCLDNIPDIKNHPESYKEKYGNWLIEPPAQAMPDDYKCDTDPVKAYRDYYRKDKLVNITCTWKKRGKPEWLTT